MGVLSKIHFGTRDAHKIVEKKPFLLRYKTNELTLLDHYRHLSQLLPIYEVLEKKLKTQDFHPAIPIELNELLNRSSQIKKDMAFLSGYIRSENKVVILDSTATYVNYLENLAVRQNELNEELFAHFLVRILGDLFGGQKIKSYVVSLYERNKLPLKNQLFSGRDFYSFKENMLKNFSSWLNELSVDEDKVVQSANNAFIENGKVMDALEASRKSVSLFNINSFFNAKVIFASMAAVATAYTYNLLR